MPTIFRQGGLEFRIRTNDHDPPHVHVFLRESEAKIDIGSGEALRVWNMRPGDVRRAEEIVKANRTLFLEGWRKIHG